MNFINHVQETAKEKTKRGIEHYHHKKPVIVFCGVLLLIIFALAAMLASRHNELVPEIVVVEPIQAVTVQEEPPVENEQSEQPKVQCEISKKYPKSIQKWCDYITYYAQKNKLSPNLIAAIIWLESDGDPHAYSPSGAVGLMQIMPRDGKAANFKCINGPCFSNRPSIKELKDPEFNIKYGTRMLANLVKRHGETREALKAYGPENVGYTYADKVINIYKTYSKGG